MPERKEAWVECLLPHYQSPGYLPVPIFNKGDRTGKRLGRRVAEADAKVRQAILEALVPAHAEDVWIPLSLLTSVEQERVFRRLVDDEKVALQVMDDDEHPFVEWDILEEAVNQVAPEINRARVQDILRRLSDEEIREFQQLVTTSTSNNDTFAKVAACWKLL